MNAKELLNIYKYMHSSGEEEPRLIWIEEPHYHIRGASSKSTGVYHRTIYEEKEVTDIYTRTKEKNEN